MKQYVSSAPPGEPAADAALDAMVLACWGLREEDPDWDLVDPEWFADTEVQALWRWRQERHWDGRSATLIDLIGYHPAWAVRVMDAVGQWGQVVVWPGQVIPALRAAYERRRTAKILEQGLALSRDPADEDPAAWTLERLRAEMDRRQAGDGPTAADAARGFLDWQFGLQSGLSPTVLPTFSAVDAFWAGGLYPGELVVVAGRPGTGKSTWALNCTRQWCEQGRRVGYVSLEMDEQDLLTAWTAQITGIDSAMIRAGALSAEQWDAVHHAANTVYGWPLRLWTHSVRLGELVGLLRRWAVQGLDVAVVDYLQRITRPPRPGTTDTDLLGECSAALKSLAGDLRIPVLLISSMNRQSEYRQNGMPQLSDLRGSGDIEHDASKVALLYRPEVDGSAGMVPVGVVLAKTRLGGKTGETRLTLHGPSGRMASAARDLGGPS